MSSSGFCSVVGMMMGVVVVGVELVGVALGWRVGVGGPAAGIGGKIKIKKLMGVTALAVQPSLRLRKAKEKSR